MISLILGILILSSLMSSVIVLSALMRSSQLSAREGITESFTEDKPCYTEPNEPGMRTKIIYTLRALGQENRINF